MPRKKKEVEETAKQENDVKAEMEAETKPKRKRKKDPEPIAEPVMETKEGQEEAEKRPEDSNSRPARYRNIGSYSADIENEFAFSNLSQSEEEDKAFRYLRKCKYDGEILVGTVIAIEDDPKRMMLGVRLSYEPSGSRNHYGRVEVLIPEMVFFEPGVKFSRDYEKKPLKDQYRIRKSAILQYLGAKIHFCVIGISRSRSEDPAFPDQLITNVIGDRRMAMAKLRDKYFFHQNRKTAAEPITIKPGDLVEAFVVSVSYQMVTVVSLGVETRIYLHDLTRENVASCYEFAKAGDVLPECQVLSVEIDDQKVKLRLTNNRSKAPKSILSMKKGSFYRGRVTWYNADKDLYTIYLDNGVTAFVYRSNVMGYVDLSINDFVSVCVTSILDNKVGGNAVKI